ncbi:Ubiquitin-conjugating enzyme E2 R1 [Geodia barretti]|uniref:Ubiquitin-conjugating enzyme E2 R1 n=2 Tax=Geodia barretti TaxID=519541 RepID=A0AA35S4S2_GEOBA|nr:Ubiquitin-conjugating enzyme E2 R1 [Geodia barretti]
MASANATSIRALTMELKALHRDPVEGFTVTVPDDSDMYVWHVAIFGPPDTPYQGGYFKAEMKFPVDYPYSPPRLRFLTPILHPNVYTDGELCISILHPPGEDPHSGERPEERWNPTQSVRTILLSVISLLNEPNTFSAANVDASVLYRRWRDSRGKDKQYIDQITKQIDNSRREAELDGVRVPTTLEEYCQLCKPKTQSQSSYDVEDDLLTTDDYYQDSSADELESTASEQTCSDIEEDSGTA